ncbi:MAG: amidohydrolase family protein [Rhodospirillales bacterium]|nr:MAG: amidohydrolase family protein [Rhodospirillales bacterium]
MRQLGITVAAILAMSAAAGLAVAQTSETPARVLITNVDVWDGTSDAVAKGVDVLVEGNKIKNVAKGIKASGATVIDGQGGTVTPGLIDMHQHLMLNGGTAAGNEWDAYVQGAHASRAAEYLLRSGFTTIRDIAGNSIGLKRAINMGILPGPRVYTSGPPIGPTGGHSDWGSRVAAPGEQNYQQKVQNTHVVDGRAEWLRASRWNLRNGADFLKVMAGGGVASEFDPLHLQSPSPEEMAAAVQAANEYGTYVAIHAYTDDAYLKSIKAGVISFEHGFLTTEKSIRELAKAGAWWSFQPYGGYTILCGEFPDWYTEGMKAKGKMVCEGVKTAIKLMKEYEIKTFNGSDMFGWDNWHNALVNVTTPTLDLPDDLKYTSLESMKMSTSLPGQFLRENVNQNRNDFLAAKLGVVEKDAWADILIWDGDPTQDISLILEEQNLKMVMKDGKVFKNLLVDPTHESFRAAPAPAGHSFNL